MLAADFLIPFVLFSGFFLFWAYRIGSELPRTESKLLLAWTGLVMIIALILDIASSSTDKLAQLYTLLVFILLIPFFICWYRAFSRDQKDF